MLIENPMHIKDSTVCLLKFFRVCFANKVWMSIMRVYIYLLINLSIILYFFLYKSYKNTSTFPESTLIRLCILFRVCQNNMINILFYVNIFLARILDTYFFAFLMSLIKVTAMRKRKPIFCMVN